MPSDNETDQQDIENAVSEGGAYEVIRKRLLSQGKTLAQQTGALNEARVAEFGSTGMAVTAHTRVRTGNNCVARDIVQVGDLLLFGYNVFIGLKQETRVSDVFALFRLQLDGEHAEMTPVVLDDSFLSQRAFLNDFTELYRYYKHAHLSQLRINNGRLLMEFRTSERLEDVRVFRWSLSADMQQVSYMDNRGERDIELPPPYDFEWAQAGRDDIINGRHPHINVLDQVFVDTLGGKLTLKIENNTEDGQGIYSEPVEDDTQSLADTELYYAQLGSIVLLKIRPYREDQWRYLVYSGITQEVRRIDAVGDSCVQLPEDHGIIFPGGYVLGDGSHKTYGDQTLGLRFRRMLPSPNGEDVLYVFYNPAEGAIGLFAYNLIRKELRNPIYAHGHAIAEDGTLVIFTAEEEPRRVHPMQIWQTPFMTQEFAGREPVSDSFFGRVGNADLVRGISDLHSIYRLVDSQTVSARVYGELRGSALKVFDDYYWITDEATGGVAKTLKEIASTAELVVDEFEKVESIRKSSAQALREAEQQQESLLALLSGGELETIDAHVSALQDLARQRGHLATIAEYRYIDRARIEALDQVMQAEQDRLNSGTVEFLANEDALAPYLQKLDELNSAVGQADTVAGLDPVLDSIEETIAGLDLLSGLVGTLKVDDATRHTRIIDAISEVYGKLNQGRANARHKRKRLGSDEAVAQFGAQFKLLSQSIAHGLGLANTPEACDEQLSRLLVQLEELEGQFSQYEEFLGDIMDKREEIHESFESRKQQLLDERQRKARAVADAAGRVLVNIERRVAKFNDTEQLNTYFASDPLVFKVRELVSRLRELDDSVQADDVEARFKAIREQALRAMRDKTDIFEDGGKVIRLGPRHRFSVNTQELDLTIIPRDGTLHVHLSGTDFSEPLASDELEGLRAYWDIGLESETEQVYRAEYLAYQVLQAAQKHEQGLDFVGLRQAAANPEALNQLVREYARPRFKEGYERGIHDHDAACILAQLVPALERADLLRYPPKARALAQVFWVNRDIVPAHSARSESWPERARSAANLHEQLASGAARELLAGEVSASLREFLKAEPIETGELDIFQAAEYLVAELSRDHFTFIGGKYALQLVTRLKDSLDQDAWRRKQEALDKLAGRPADRWMLTGAWLQALVRHQGLAQLERHIPEAIALINTEERIGRRPSEADLDLQVSGLLGQHPIVEQQSLSLSVDTFLNRLQQHRQQVVPGHRRYLALRQATVEAERRRLRLSDFKARPLSSFVRNRIINDAYLPFIGDNLAKQMGTIGEDKRTDLMGLLIMISPPGYGKTTLMEYVANRLGLVFMKINCPSLGHEVVSLDPAQAPHATAAQELRKLNLGLEMGNNVMLYLDDIQHTHPEFLQKFISLCDATRRIEGVWKDQTRTYDLRGKKFCVVMAGNPYTESGESFKIPDMLANRADIYNLGDVLGGMDEQFALSYIENSLTSNSVLAPLATRDLEDAYKLVEMARGAEISATELSHQYSSVELTEITGVLRKLFVIRDVVLRVNREYIKSAAQDDRYRTEPPFKLQGSYRNMNKMAEKVSAVMNDHELMAMIADHYVGEAQLLTTGAEHNLLKLAQLRGNMTADEQARWDAIIVDFRKHKAMGGDDADAVTRVASQLHDIAGGLAAIGEAVAADKSLDGSLGQIALSLAGLRDDLAAKLEGGSEPAEQAARSIAEQIAVLRESLSTLKPQVHIDNHPSQVIEDAMKTMAQTIETTFLPVVQSMDRKIDLDLTIVRKVNKLSQDIHEFTGRTDPHGQDES